MFTGLQQSKMRSRRAGYRHLHKAGMQTELLLHSSFSDRLWLQFQRSGFDSRRYQIFLEVVGVERGLLSLVSIIEEQLRRKSSGFGLENGEYGLSDPSR
jgi:hypothetical protein